MPLPILSLCSGGASWPRQHSSQKVPIKRTETPYRMLVLIFYQITQCIPQSRCDSIGRAHIWPTGSLHRVDAVCLPPKLET